LISASTWYSLFVQYIELLDYRQCRSTDWYIACYIYRFECHRKTFVSSCSEYNRYSQSNPLDK
jgi:hypothetical protein